MQCNKLIALRAIYCHTLQVCIKINIRAPLIVNNGKMDKFYKTNLFSLNFHNEFITKLDTFRTKH